DPGAATAGRGSAASFTRTSRSTCAHEEPGGCGRGSPRILRARASSSGGGSSPAGRIGSLRWTFRQRCPTRRSPRSSGWCRSRQSESVSTTSSRSARSEEHTSELQSRGHLVCRLLLEKKKKHEKNSL